MDCLMKYQDPRGEARYISIDPIPEMKAPDTAVVGEKQIRLSSEARVGLWQEDGGWLVLAWSTDDAPRAEHEALIERSEGNTSPLAWLTLARVAMYLSLSGEPCKASIRLCKEAMQAVPQPLKHQLTPKRFPSAYKVQGDLVQVWVPL